MKARLPGSDATATFVEAERNANDRLVATGTLTRGMKIGGERHRDFELQESITADLLAAEDKADTSKALNFNAALMARQFVRIGSYDGPVTASMIATLSKGDFATLREAQAELDLLGEVLG